MSREIEIDGKRVKVVTISDIAPNGIEEFKELCKSAEPAKAGFWSAAQATTRPARPEDFLPKP